MSNFSYVTGSSALTWSGSVAVPVVGAPITAQSVTEGFRTLADRTAKLSASLGGNFSLSSSIATDVRKAFGGLIASRSTGLQVFIQPTGSSYTGGTGWQSGSWWNFPHPVSLNTTAGGQGITASVAGLYRATTQFDWDMTGAGLEGFYFSFGVNNTPVTSTMNRVLIDGPGGETYKFIHYTGYLNLSANDIVTVQVRNTGSASESFIMYNGNLFIERV